MVISGLNLDKIITQFIDKYSLQTTNKLEFTDFLNWRTNTTNNYSTALPHYNKEIIPEIIQDELLIYSYMAGKLKITKEKGKQKRIKSKDDLWLLRYYEIGVGTKHKPNRTDMQLFETAWNIEKRYKRYATNYSFYDLIYELSQNKRIEKYLGSKLERGELELIGKDAYSPRAGLPKTYTHQDTITALYDILRGKRKIDDGSGKKIYITAKNYPIILQGGFTKCKSPDIQKIHYRLNNDRARMSTETPVTIFNQLCDKEEVRLYLRLN